MLGNTAVPVGYADTAATARYTSVAAATAVTAISIT